MFLYFGALLLLLFLISPKHIFSKYFSDKLFCALLLSLKNEYFRVKSELRSSP